MFKVSLVGHSQIPYSLNVHNSEIRIFRAPGGRASSFFSDERLNRVLSWKHDLCLLWLGSNDIADGIDPSLLTNTIREITRTIERDCEAVVCICLIEPRLYSGVRPISAENYKKVQHSINNRIKRCMRNQVIHFNSNFYVESLSSDGVHWSSAGRSKVEDKLITVIKGHMSAVLETVENHNF